MIQEQMASARIYQFPVGGRSGQRALNDAKRPAVSDAALPRGAAIAVGESWYHAEAVQAAQTALT